MIPQYQKIIDADKGDCNRACVATITGIPIDELPSNGEGHKFGYYGALQEVLDKHGWIYLETGPRLYWWVHAVLAGVPVIASVPSQSFQDRMHSVVVTAGDDGWLKLLHDPNPNNKPYDLVKTEIKGWSMLIRKDGLPGA